MILKSGAKRGITNSHDELQVIHLTALNESLPFGAGN